MINKNSQMLRYSTFAESLKYQTASITVARFIVVKSFSMIWLSSEFYFSGLLLEKDLNSFSFDNLFVDLASGGRSADPPSAGAESAAGRADPEEAHPHGHPEEKQQTAHPAAF